LGRRGLPHAPRGERGRRRITIGDSKNKKQDRNELMEGRLKGGEGGEE